MSNIESILNLVDSYYDLTNDTEKYLEYIDKVYIKYSNNFIHLNYN